MGATPEVAAVVLQELNDENIDQFGSEYAEKSLVLLESVKLDKIGTVDQFTRVAAAGLDAAANINAITNYLTPLKDARYKAWKRVCNVLADKCEPFERVKAKAGKLVAQYQYEEEQERKRREEEERRKADEEQEKLRAQQAEQLAKEGRIEDGIALLDSEPVATAPVVSTTTVPRVRGVSAPTPKYHAEVTDLMALIKAVAEGKVPILAICADQKFLDQQARSMKKLLQYPGVAVKEDFSTSFRPK